jgi:hypothetical protein
MSEKIDREEYGPEGWFNDGVIVREDVEKPCFKLRFCPYGSIAEGFWAGRLIYYYNTGESSKEKYHCNAFAHDCPTFYISVEATEESKVLPEKHSSLKDDPSRLKRSKRKMKLYHRPNYSYEKPCHKIGYCPYGSFARDYTNEPPQEEYRCKLYGKECPVYYFRFPAVDHGSY